MNNSSDVSTPQDLQPSMGEAIAIGIIMTMLSVSILLGNGLVIFVCAKNKRLQVPKYYFILSLAVSDLLIGLFSVNFMTVYLIYGSWPLGYLTCNIWLTLDYSSAQVSTLTLLAISLERFFKVNNAVFYRNKITKCIMKKFVFCIWLVSFIVWGASINLYSTSTNVLAKRECYIQFLYDNSNVRNPVLALITSFLFFYGPVIVMTIIYVRLSIVLFRRYQEMTKRRQHIDTITANGSTLPSPNLTSELKHDEKKLNSPILSLKAVDENSKEMNLSDNEKGVKPYRNLIKKYLAVEFDSTGLSLTSLTTPDRTPNPSPSRSPNRTPNTSANNSPVHQKKKKKKLKKRSTETQKQYVVHKKAITLLLLVMLAYVVTCFPYNLLSLILPFCELCINKRLWNFAYTLYFVNSLLNPFCYAFGNQDFKKAFKKVYDDLKENLCL